MFADCRIGYAQNVDWEVPSHADSGPEGEVQPVAVPSGPGGGADGPDLRSAGPPGVAGDFPGDLADLGDHGDQDEPPASGARAAVQPADPGQPGVAADRHQAWRSMFRRRAAGPAGQDAGDQRQPRHSAARPHLIRPQLARRHDGRRQIARSRPHIARPQLASLPLVSRPLANPQLRADPRVRIWATRIAIVVVLYFGIMLWHGWRLGLTIAALYAAADIIFRSKTTAVIPPSIRVTAAQRSTRRRLKVLEPAGYLALHACTIPGMQPGTRSVIDHLVVGPAGVFVLDSERWDRRLPVRTIGGRLYHGPVNQEERLKHSRWEAHQAATLLGAELGHPVKVHPAMIIYGPKVPWTVNKLQAVDVFDGGRVSTFFRRQSKATASHQLSTSQIAAIYTAAARVLPPLAASDASQARQHTS